MSSELLTTKEAAARLDISPFTMRAWRMKGIGPRYFRYGDGLKGRVRYDAGEIQSWLARRSFENISDEKADMSSRRRSR